MDNDKVVVNPVRTTGEARQENTSRWEDYIDIYFAPTELFRRRVDDRLGPPLIALLVFALVVYFILPVEAMVLRTATANDPQAAEVLDTFATLMQLFGAIFVPIKYLLGIVSAAFLLWIGGKLADIPVRFSRMLLVATYAAFVQPLSELASGLLVLLHGESGLDVVRHGSLGVLRFIGGSETAPLPRAILQRVDFFAIWQAALWAVGVAVCCRASRTRAAIIAGTTWALFALPGVLGALISVGASGP